MIEKFENFKINEESDYIPVIERAAEPDRKGRDIRIGMRHGNSTIWLPVVNEEGLRGVRDMIENFMKNNK